MFFSTQQLVLSLSFFFFFFFFFFRGAFKEKLGQRPVLPRDLVVSFPLRPRVNEAFRGAEDSGRKKPKPKNPPPLAGLFFGLKGSGAKVG